MVENKPSLPSARPLWGRENRLLYRALKLAGPIETALDLPCGIGRSWPAFAKAGVSKLIAADVSPGMVQIAQSNHLDPHMPERTLVTSALDIDLSNNAVEFTACLRYFDLLSARSNRQQTLAELHRVTHKFVAISLRVDSASTSRQRHRTGDFSGTCPEVCLARGAIEWEFEDAGFKIVTHFDVWPRISLWRLYLLRCAHAS